MNQDETMVMLKAKDLQGIQDELKAYKELVTPVRRAHYGEGRKRQTDRLHKDTDGLCP